MNKYTQKSGKWVYQPNQTTPFRLSRTRIEMFLDCHRCFYLANRLGLGRPSMPGFSLNTAVDELLKKEFDFEIPVLIKTEKEIKKIADAIPKNWQNDKQQRTDIAYLFKEFDYEKIVTELPFNKDVVDIRYVKGAVFWNLSRKDYNKSRLNKLIGRKFYKYMTLRNVNTARFLAKQK